MLKSHKNTHVYISEGIKRHGEKEMNALLSRFGQLHKYNTFDPQPIENLTNEVNKKYFNLITMVKMKTCGKIEAKAFADGRK